jgi:hypothetical protein
MLRLALLLLVIGVFVGVFYLLRAANFSAGMGWFLVLLVLFLYWMFPVFRNKNTKSRT